MMAKVEDPEAWRTRPNPKGVKYINRSAKALRKEIGYEKNIARCETCKFYKRPHLFLVNSLPRRAHALCRKYEIDVAPNSVCDNWISKNGKETV